MKRRDWEAYVHKDFVKHTEKHELKIIKDDGVYRHMRFGDPDTIIYSMHVTTWPGHLAVTGDMGTYLFSRIEDMFKFFRHDRPNPQYWAEKCQASDERCGMRGRAGDRSIHTRVEL